MTTPFKNGQRVWWKDPFSKDSGYRTIACDAQKYFAEAVRVLGEESIREDGFQIVVIDDAGAASEVYAHELEPIYEGTCDDLSQRERELRLDMHWFILQQIRKAGGRITLKIPQTDDECEGFDFPVTSTLYGRHDNDNVDITDVYANPDYSTIYADGQVDGDIQKGYQIHPEQYSDVFWFIRHVQNI